MALPSEIVAAKKRIMFIKGEDFNFLTYNILLVLHQLDATSRERSFVDHRKLAYLVDFVSSSALTGLLARRRRLNVALSMRDAHSLTAAYAHGVTRRHLILRILSALERRAFVTTLKEANTEQIAVYLNVDQVPPSFLTSPTYESERINLRELRSLFPMLRRLTFDTFLARFFKEHGVTTWHS